MPNLSYYQIFSSSPYIYPFSSDLCGSELVNFFISFLGKIIRKANKNIIPDHYSFVNSTLYMWCFFSTLKTPFIIVPPPVFHIAITIARSVPT
jgi:hypothetical protein